MNAPVDNPVDPAASNPESEDVVAQEDTPATDAVETDPVVETEGAATEETDIAENDSVNVQEPEFSDVPVAASQAGTAMEHLQDVPVEVSAELGRVSMTLGELLRIGEGAVIKLNRQVSAPVELIAQGVRVAMADVVVVDDCFAVRIRSIERSR